MTRLLQYIWWSCVITLCQRFPTVFKPRCICHFIQGHLMWLPVRGFTRPLRTLVAITSGEKLEIPDNPPESREGSGNYLISHYIVY